MTQENNPSMEWEKEFDAEFWLHRIPKNTKQMQDIKRFIRETLTAQREEYKKLIEGMKKNCSDCKNGGYNGDCTFKVFDETLDAVLEAISK